MQLETPTTVGRTLGVTSARVRQLDEELQPMRTADGRRVYHPATVDRLAAQREFARAMTADAFRVARHRGKEKRSL
jgi:hypothetical protein